MVSLPTALRADLVSTYSAALYGAKERINLSTIRVMWPAALGTEARATLTSHSTRCGLPDRELAASSAPQPYLDVPNSFANANALWVQQPAERLLGPAASDTWVEVSHCFYYSFPENVSPQTPIWFFATPGSGLSLNVGRTLVVSEQQYGVKNVGRLHRWLVSKAGLNTSVDPHRLHQNIDRLLQANTFGAPQSAGPPGMKPPSALDTLQFPLRGVHRSWGSERFTEIVALGWGREMSFIHSWLRTTPHLRCGKHPWLRPCTPNDAAVRAHGPNCARVTPPLWLLRQTGCSVDLNNSFHRSMLEGKRKFASMEAKVMRRRGLNMTDFEHFPGS